MGQSVFRMEKEISKKVRLSYLLHIPNEYGKGPDGKWPLILFLHGAGERGDNIEKVKIHGIPKIADRDPDFPFICVSPQCPGGSYWVLEQDAVMALVEEIVHGYHVDENRIYVTGLSMGGYGTWHLGCEYPDKFAAIVPICGGGDPDNAEALKHTPVWAFHGAKDAAVPVAESERMVKKLEQCGGNVKFTVYPDKGHICWAEAYDSPELYSWLLSHTLEKRA